MQELGEKGLVRAGKDISNPGLLGTLGMLLETSGVGAVVDVEAIAVPSGLDLVSWLKMYPGMGFVVTTKAENADAVIEVFQKRGLTAHVIGRVTEEKKLVIRRGFVDGGATDGAEKEEFVLFDFEKECVTGIH